MSLNNISLKQIFVVSLLFHMVAALFSVGFHQYDEHFQILEFLNYKWGMTPAKELPWEFSDRLRPWFQVGIYHLFLWPSRALGLENPFVMATLLRGLTGVVHLLSLFSLKGYLESELKNDQEVKLAFLLLNFTWFIPYLHARSSAEGLGGAFLLLGFSYLMKALRENQKMQDSLFAGLFLGVSYLCKVQFALSVAFLWFWMLVFKSGEKRVIFLSAFSILLMILLGPLVDYWGYGEWTFTPWNYFDVNILQSKASQYGVDPWWYYFKKGIVKGVPPLSLFLLIGAIGFFIKKPGHSLTWMSIPFLLIHFMIPHKELRFLFPIISLFPLMMLFFFKEQGIEKFKKYKKTLIFFVGVNFIALFISILKPAHSAIGFYQSIYSKGISTLSYLTHDPYSITNLNIFYYKKEGLKTKKAESPQTGYIFSSKTSDIEKLKTLGCENLFLSYPRWLVERNDFNWTKRSRIWSLFHCP